MSQKHRQRIVCSVGRQGDYFFKKEPLSVTARFGCCRSSKCPYHMLMNRTCTAHRAVYITDGCWTSKTRPNRPKCCCLLRLSIDQWTRAIRSSSDVTPYSSYYPTENSREVWEVIPHISIEVRRWLKVCVPAVLGQQNESEQIVTPACSQTSTLYSTQTVRFRTGIRSWTMIIMPSCTHTERYRCFWDTLWANITYIIQVYKFQNYIFSNFWREVK